MQIKIHWMLLMGMSMNTQALNIDRCFMIASVQYNIPSKLLKAIAQTETKLDSLAVNINSNRTYDIGIMQINSSWLPKLNRVGITEADLFDGCKNIQIGAWILASNIKYYGFSTKAIGSYNSPFPINQERYVRKVLSNLK